MESSTGTQLHINNAVQQIVADNACVSGSSFTNVAAENLTLDNVTLAGTKIMDANLSDLEIDGAQIGGAYIHNIGMPREGHPAYEPGAEQRPVRFEMCHLNNSTFDNCQLVNVELRNCNISGLKINGIDIEALLNMHSNPS
ncbi:pentapeptide repeat-containing protein [Paenibacillus profundus]|uniref:Pentapeptide repeat-containing protein n=1 Tax=Paenibacillus profundus TaxID=1173085 RepID=A0ABS8YF75_9BACL|nr:MULTISPECIES: pentapeptide repeat-containing protein [Paenibacillus]MCE5169874.1 pentapeptide repeat-containing protein [Paenibacillus profundus]MCM3342163.1 pentapeptide repeat-containing protein [Paenibacillus sp. MER TA 81-3]